MVCYSKFGPVLDPWTRLRTERYHVTSGDDQAGSLRFQKLAPQTSLALPVGTKAPAEDQRLPENLKAWDRKVVQACVANRLFPSGRPVHALIFHHEP